MAFALDNACHLTFLFVIKPVSVLIQYHYDLVLLIFFIITALWVSQYCFILLVLQKSWSVI